MHAYEVYAHEVNPHEMYARKVLAKTFRSPTLQTVWWSICRDLSCKLRVFALRVKRSLSASVPAPATPLRRPILTLGPTHAAAAQTPPKHHTAKQLATCHAARQRPHS